MTRRTWPRPISTSLSARASTRKKTPARTCALSRRSDATTRAGAAAGRSSRSATARDANRRSALPRKRHAQSRRVEEIVALAAGRGIAQEAIAGRRVPVQPFRELRGDAEIERDAILARVGEIVEHAIPLHQRHGLRQLERVVVDPAELAGCAVQA